jgi:hypothetical protein
MDGIDNLARRLNIATLTMDHAVAKEHKEGAIVALADIMAAIHRVWEEALIYNNHHFVQPAKGMQRVLDGVIQHIKEKEFFNPDQEEYLLGYYDELTAILTEVLKHPCALVELHDAD